MKIGFDFKFLLLIIYTVGINGRVEIKDGDVIQPKQDILKKKYLKNADQTWNLVASTGHWALVFHYLSIEKSNNCQHDYLEIHEPAGDGFGAVKPVRTRYCGEITPLPYISRTSKLILHFVSDSIWELRGFNITAFYGEHKETLESKVHEMANRYTVTLALEVEDTREEGFHSKGAVFYVLIGSSVAALVLFGILLTYFVIVMRRQIYTHKTRVPKLYYISGAAYMENSKTTREPFEKLNSASPKIKTAQELCDTGKRRYSKEKKATKTTAGETTDVKFVEPNCRSQHNNMYVSNALVHVCPN